MTWTAQMRMDARFMYEKQGKQLEEIALAVGKTVAGVRMMLVKAGVYQAKATSATKVLVSEFQVYYNKYGPALF